jgi:hypothetical protein
LSNLNKRLLIQAAFAGLLTFAGAQSALANGDDFFNNPLDEKVPLDQQIVYVGTVKDEEGNFLDNVSITIRVPVPPGYSLEPVTYNAYTNIIGRFRTLDALSVVASMVGADLDIAARDIEISAKKDGYTVARRMNRARSTQNRGLFEINFILEKNG